MQAERLEKKLTERKKIIWICFFLPRGQLPNYVNLISLLFTAIGKCKNSIFHIRATVHRFWLVEFSRHKPRDTTHFDSENRQTAVFFNSRLRRQIEHFWVCSMPKKPTRVDQLPNSCPFTIACRLAHFSTSFLGSTTRFKMIELLRALKNFLQSSSG